MEIETCKKCDGYGIVHGPNNTADDCPECHTEGTVYICPECGSKNVSVEGVGGDDYTYGGGYMAVDVTIYTCADCGHSEAD